MFGRFKAMNDSFASYSGGTLFETQKICTCITWIVVYNSLKTKAGIILKAGKLWCIFSWFWGRVDSSVDNNVSDKYIVVIFRVKESNIVLTIVKTLNITKLSYLLFFLKQWRNVIFLSPDLKWTCQNS